MNVTTIRIPEAEAKEKLRAYRKQLHRRADDEFAACAAGYEQLAKGRALLNVADAIRSAPRDEKNRPRLAIARADRHQVHYLESSGRDRFCKATPARRQGPVLSRSHGRARRARQTTARSVRVALRDLSEAR